MRSRDGIDQSGKFEISVIGVLLLAVATMVASGIVFLLGIYVGKGMVEQRLAQESRVVRLPVPTPSAGGSGKGDEVDVTFWDKLGKGEATPRPAAAPSPTAAETPLRVSPLGATPVPPPTERKVEAPPTPAPTRPPPAVVEGGSFQVQVNAMADKARADELVRDLKSLGYAPFISPGAGRRQDALSRAGRQSPVGGSGQAGGHAIARAGLSKCLLGRRGERPLSAMTGAIRPTYDDFVGLAQAGQRRADQL